jgi:hypothetical protein
MAPQNQPPDGAVMQLGPDSPAVSHGNPGASAPQQSLGPAPLPSAQAGPRTGGVQPTPALESTWEDIAHTNSAFRGDVSVEREGPPSVGGTDQGASVSTLAMYATLVAGPPEVFLAATESSSSPPPLAASAGPLPPPATNSPQGPACNPDPSVVSTLPLCVDLLSPPAVLIFLESLPPEGPANQAPADVRVPPDALEPPPPAPLQFVCVECCPADTWCWTWYRQCISAEPCDPRGCAVVTPNAYTT